MVLVFQRYTLINMGPNTTTFVIAADSASRTTPGSFWFRSLMGKLGAAFGYLVFQFLLQSDNAAEHTQVTATWQCSQFHWCCVTAVAVKRMRRRHNRQGNRRQPSEHAHDFHSLLHRASTRLAVFLDFFIPFDELVIGRRLQQRGGRYPKA